jgi:hypothetical protein
MWLSNTATAAMMVPLAVAILSELVATVPVAAPGQSQDADGVHRPIAGHGRSQPANHSTPSIPEADSAAPEASAVVTESGASDHNQVLSRSYTLSVLYLSFYYLCYLSLYYLSLYDLILSILHGRTVCTGLYNPVG